MPNAFVHVELNTQDVAKAREFYSQLFQWTLQEMPMADGTQYTVIGVGQGTGGGVLKHPMPGAPSFWLPYVHVEDIEASTEKAKSLGAKMVREITEVPNMGWFSIFLDPTGACMALWKPKM